MILPYFLLLAIDTHHQPRIPLHFEPNQGQVAGETEWIAKAPGGTLFINSTAIAFATTEPSKRPRIIRFVGARNAKGEGQGDLGSYSNYFTGRDEHNWHSGIPHFAKVRYKNLYDGIDLVYYTTPAQQIEYDFDVAPGADIRQIVFAFDGFDKVELGSDGDLLIHYGKSTLKQKRPQVKQDGIPVTSRYEKRGDRWGLAIDSYDETRTLAIDPVLDFATYLGGPGRGGSKPDAWRTGIYVYVK